MNGKLKDWSFSRTGESVLTITTRESCKKLWDALGDQEITFSIKRRVVPRSLNANNYAWSLIEKLAVAVKSDKDSVYEEMLRRYGTGETYTDEAGNECKVLFSLREGVPPALVARHYEAQKKKMQGLCDEHDLVYRFEKDRYPIIFTIKPVQGMDAQISMLENVEEVGYRSPDASMSWIFEDGGLDTKVTGGTFTISKTLRTKIESILVKMITYWQQYFFRDVLEKNALRSGLMPVIDEDEAGDTDEEPEDEGDMQGEDGPEVDLDDPDIQQAITIVRAENKATVGLLQRRMSVGYAKAARLIDALEELGVVGPYNGSDGREVLPTDEPDDTEGGED